jgi:hypothetical protein
VADLAVILIACRAEFAAWTHCVHPNWTLKGASLADALRTRRAVIIDERCQRRGIEAVLVGWTRAELARRMTLRAESRSQRFRTHPRQVGFVQDLRVVSDWTAAKTASAVDAGRGGENGVHAGWALGRHARVSFTRRALRASRSNARLARLVARVTDAIVVRVEAGAAAEYTRAVLQVRVRTIGAADGALISARPIARAPTGRVAREAQATGLSDLIICTLRTATPQFNAEERLCR